MDERKLQWVLVPDKSSGKWTSVGQRCRNHLLLRKDIPYHIRRSALVILRQIHIH